MINLSTSIFSPSYGAIRCLLGAYMLVGISHRFSVVVFLLVPWQLPLTYLIPFYQPSTYLPLCSCDVPGWLAQERVYLRSFGLACFWLRGEKCYPPLSGSARTLQVKIRGYPSESVSISYSNCNGFIFYPCRICHALEFQQNRGYEKF